MPASTIVLPVRTEPSDSEILVGRPPRGPWWSELGRLTNYVRGRGVMLVPAHAPMITIASGANDTIRYRCRPGGLAIARVWVVHVEAVSGYANVTVAAGSATATILIDALEAREAGRVVLIDGGLTKTTAVTELTATVTNNSGTGSVIIGHAEVWELPRAALTKGATDLGVDIDTLFAGRPILERANDSTYGVAAALHTASGRRGTLAAWYGPVVSSTATTWTGLFPNVWRVTPGVIGVGATSIPCEWDVNARVTDGATTFELRLTDAAAASSAVITIAGVTTLGWRGTGTKDLLAEDLTDDTGLQGGAFETVQLEVRRTAGAGSLEVRGFGVWESLW